MTTKTDCPDGATIAEAMANARKLAADPELRKEVETRIRSTLPPDMSFGIDELGIGHFWGPLLTTKRYGGLAQLGERQAGSL